MKTAEDFRMELGENDESFERCVRQTLRALECEEVKPVKKKLSLGLVLAAAIMLLAVTAVAAGSWGILDFMKENGESASEELLVTQPNQDAYLFEQVRTYLTGKSQSELVDITIEEALYSDGWLYAAMTVKPKQEKTMVIGDEMQEVSLETGEVHLSYMHGIRDISEPGSMKKYAERLGVDPGMSVKEYAEAQGFEHVVRVAVAMLIKQADYELLEDGSLRMIVQMEYNYAPRENYPDEIMRVFFSVNAAQYDENGKLPEDWEDYEHIELEADGIFRVDSRTRRSRPEDAHDIVGYRGYIESISVTPISEEQVSLVLQLDEQKRNYDEMQMSGPDVLILNEAGEVLFEYTELRSTVESMIILGGDRIRHIIVMPGACLQEDSITIRLVSWRNHNIIYDEYTYTLE